MANSDDPLISYRERLTCNFPQLGQVFPDCMAKPMVLPLPTQAGSPLMGVVMPNVPWGPR